MIRRFTTKSFIYRTAGCPPLSLRNVSRVLPYIVAESEEKDSTPEWGEINSEDTCFDSVEDISKEDISKEDCKK